MTSIDVSKIVHINFQSIDKTNNLGVSKFKKGLKLYF